MYYPAHTGVKGNDQADRLASKTTVSSMLCLVRFEVVRNLRHNMQSESSTDHLQERGVERGNLERTRKVQSQSFSEQFQTLHWGNF